MIQKTKDLQYIPLSRDAGLSGYQALAERVIDTPLGKVSLAANQFGLSHLSFLPGQDDDFTARQVTLIECNQEAQIKAQAHLEQAEDELAAYFAGQLTAFNVALAPVGTTFQHQVWQALLAHPFGAAASYSDIASAIDNPKAVRAVGSANGANRIAIIIPCHRIIGKDGALTGYAYGLAIKQQLLALEAKAVGRQADAE
ncbi:methylated-DNA--[protein]-cysteine S-methyltransferase [Shewanella sp. Isolate8]|uniref:methylated-DNA--[protein]-cysteine S-methyltransferase n=1 Tax=Shewanella sp. Isolate8 TaxID=2908529 RepID=UPI001EFC7949|nr:methylated-DNA--[protein]-cysteine S-methyltransferase [Shewanella sp. Isolate8]MCG9745943.1 methylated-DNA--[protein]-cysteine S-methyltransferase [Shewanella sp. Isolate8]